MRVILFKIDWLNIKQAFIGLFTFSKVSHAALLFKGTYMVYEASENTGFVGYGRHIRKWGNQKITVYEIPEDELQPMDYALSKNGYPYDYKSWFGWIPFISTNDPEAQDCFELVLQTLLSMPKINGFSTQEIAGDVRQKLFEKRVDSDDIYLVLERCQLEPIYRGKASEYA